MPQFLLASPWPGLIVWSLLYISDYTLTLKCARLYQGGVNEKMIFEGSYEITPYFQRDIDTLRSFSPRFMAMLVIMGALLTAQWWIANTLFEPRGYQFILGILIGVQLAIHIRHFRNLFLFRAILAGNAVRGRIEYLRPAMLRGSSIELLAFCGLYLVLFAFTRSWFLLGGAFGCLSIALKHWRLFRVQQKNAPGAIASQLSHPSSQTVRSPIA